jgi:hypothetical protein
MSELISPIQLSFGGETSEISKRISTTFVLKTRNLILITGGKTMLIESPHSGCKRLSQNCSWSTLFIK